LEVVYRWLKRLITGRQISDVDCPRCDGKGFISSDDDSSSSSSSGKNDGFSQSEGGQCETPSAVAETSADFEVVPSFEGAEAQLMNHAYSGQFDLRHFSQESHLKDCNGDKQNGIEIGTETESVETAVL
jgi:hypothetical protein